MLNVCFQGTCILGKPEIPRWLVKVGCVKGCLIETQSAMDPEKKTTAEQWRGRLSWALNAE